MKDRYADGSSLRRTVRTGERTYGAVVSVVRATSQAVQQVYNQQVLAVKGEAALSIQLETREDGTDWLNPL
ncbi:MAG: hypothetical protein AAGJ55_03970 [Cyanobacteria bacterium J06555_12]